MNREAKEKYISESRLMSMLGIFTYFGLFGVGNCQDITAKPTVGI